MRDTLFCEYLRKGGVSSRRAAVLERWIDDKTPGGFSSDELYGVLQLAAAEECRALRDEIETLQRAIHAFDFTDMFARVPMISGH